MEKFQNLYIVYLIIEILDFGGKKHVAKVIYKAKIIFTKVF